MPAIIALASLVLAQGLQSPVTVKTGLGSVTEALAALSQATGVVLRASPQNADFPLMIRVEGMTGAEVMKRTAEVLGAEWTRDGEAYVLSADSAIQRRVAKIPDTRRATQIGAAITAFLDTQKVVVYDEAFAQKQREEGKKMFEGMMEAMTSGRGEINIGKMLGSGAGMMGESPAARAGYTLLQRLGAEELAALPTGERVVYALNPTRMQGALPPGSLEILRRFLSETRQYRQSLKNTAVDGEAMDFLTMMNPNDKPVNPEALAGAFLEVTPGDDMIMANIRTYGADGKTIADGAVFLPVPPKVVEPTTGGVALVVDDLGREWAERYRAAAETNFTTTGGVGMGSMTFSLGGGNPRAAALARPKSPALKAFLAALGKNQPAAPLFTPIAAAIEGNLIATVPDDGMYTLAKIAEDPKSTGIRALAELEGSPQFSVTRGGGITVIGAATPTRLRRSFANRGALAGLVTALNRDGHLRLGDLTRYAIAQRTVGGAASIGQPLLTILGGSSALMFGGGTNVVTDFDTYRIYGTLSDAQRASLVAGRGVPYSALNPDARESLARLLFLSPLAPSPEIEGSENEVQDEAVNLGAIMGMLGSMGDYNAERTVRFADGVPAAGYFTAKFTTTDVYRMTDSASGATTFGGPESLGMAKGMQNIPFLKAFAGGADYDRFTPARQTTIALKFVFGPKLVAGHSIEDRETTSATSLTYAQLPKEFRETAEEIAKFADGMKFNLDGKIKP